MTMKNIISLLILIYLTHGVNAQSSLEIAVLNELNSYRTKLSNTHWKPKNADPDYDSNVGHLCKLTYDKDLSNTANYHAKYLSEITKLGLRNSSGEKAHNENIDLKNWIELSIDQRGDNLKKLNLKKELVGEIQIQQFSSPKGKKDKELAKKIISLFDGSDRHKEIMLFYFEEDLIKPIVGISVIVREDNDLNIIYHSVVIDFGIIQK
jgi:hypothetical protein